MTQELKQQIAEVIMRGIVAATGNSHRIDSLAGDVGVCIDGEDVILADIATAVLPLITPMLEEKEREIEMLRASFNEVERIATKALSTHDKTNVGECQHEWAFVEIGALYQECQKCQKCGARSNDVLGEK